MTIEGLKFLDDRQTWPSRLGKIAERVKAQIARFPGFTFVVIIPVIASVVYYGIIAAPIYLSTAQFLVKSASQNTALTGLGSFLQSTGISTTPNDAYTVNAYLASRDALTKLEQRPDIRAIYSRPEADFVTRFPNLIYGPSFENLFIHFSNWIEVDFDTSSNITTLTAYAFRPEDAQKVAAQLLELSEVEVNRINDRLRSDALRGARREVGQLQTRANMIQNQITDFRNHQLLLDPNQTSTQSTVLLSTLEAQLVSARAALAQTLKSTPGNPQIPSLRARIEAYENQVTAEERKGAGGPDSLAPKIAQYQQLLVQQQIVQQMLQAAVTSLEAAEATVQQQQLYVARISEPNLPDLALYPYRIIDILIVLFTSLLIYGTGRLLYAAIMEHEQ